MSSCCTRGDKRVQPKNGEFSCTKFWGFLYLAFQKREGNIMEITAWRHCSRGCSPECRLLVTLGNAFVETREIFPARLRMSLN